MAIGKIGDCIGTVKYPGCGTKNIFLSKPSLKLCHKCNEKKLKKNREPKVATGQADLFREIWDKSNKCSYLSGATLSFHEGRDTWYSLFAHVLAKAQNKYPKFKLYDKGIRLLTPYEHHLWDNGTIDQRKKYAEKTGCDWNKLFDLENELKEEYKRLYG